LETDSTRQQATSMYSALSAEELPHRDKFHDSNERWIREGYGKILQPIDNDRS